MIILMTIMCLVLPSAEAKKKDKGGKSNHSFMINAGGGFGLILPGFDLYYWQWNDDGYNDNTWTYIQLGGYLVGNFGMSFDMGKKGKWQFGPAIQVGWKATGGPFGGYSQVRGTKIDFWSSKEFSDDVVLAAEYGWDDRARFTHSFLADACVAFKGSQSKSARLVLEAGMRFMLAFIYNYTEWNAAYKVAGYVDGWEFDEWRFLVGPSVFIGADAFVSDNVMLTPGLRFAAAFAPDPGRTVGGHRYYYSHTYIDIAFEMKINWYTKK